VPLFYYLEVPTLIIFSWQALFWQLLSFWEQLFWLVLSF